MDETDNLTPRQKKLIYRANYRGTKEMDFLIGKFVQTEVAAMNEDELQLLEAFLSLPDPRLENWIMGRDTELPCEYKPLVLEVQRFHKMV